MNKNVTLTKREAEIAELLAWGAAKKEVAGILYISTRTVENTARNIYEKIDIQKATELCVWWFCNRCGISWDLSPIKRVISIIILMLFMQSNIAEAKEYNRYFNNRRTVRNERTVCRRYNREENE